MMKTIKIALLVLLISLASFFSVGCWNYREIDEMAIVSGVAVDKGINKKYLVTMEIVELAGGTDTKQLTRLVSVEGDSMFDAVRNVIAFIGKKAYFSHAKVVIVSQAISREGLVNVIDWFSRDTETRENIYLLVSKDETAKEIFEGKPITNEVLSFQLDKMIGNQKSLEKAPSGDLRDFINTLSTEGVCAVAPAIIVENVDGEKRADVLGTAIFKSDRLIGFLDALDTQTMRFIQNKVKGGVIYSEEKVRNSYATLEIFKSKTKIKPVIDGNNVTVEVTIDIDTAIDEIDGTGDLVEEGRKELERHFENVVNNRAAKLVKEVQTKYGTDIFGFGAKLREDKPGFWKVVGYNWDEEFKDLKVNINTKVNIKNSAQLANYLEIGD